MAYSEDFYKSENYAQGYKDALRYYLNFAFDAKNDKLYDKSDMYRKGWDQGETDARQ